MNYDRYTPYVDEVADLSPDAVAYLCDLVDVSNALQRIPRPIHRAHAADDAVHEYSWTRGASRTKSRATLAMMIAATAFPPAMLWKPSTPKPPRAIDPTAMAAADAKRQRKATKRLNGAEEAKSSAAYFAYKWQRTARKTWWHK